MRERFSGFNAEVRETLVQFFERHSSTSERKVAVFDADGTLWRGDVGEAFFQQQLERKTIPNAPKSDAWKTYFKESQSENAAQAYGWLAQWNAGVREESLQRWADAFFQENWIQNIFDPMRQLTHALLNAEFEIWVISGSMRWVVGAGVRGFGIQDTRVLGSSVHVEGGLLTDRIENVVPYRAGKAKLIESIIGAKPLFAAGNTYWDKEMLNTCTDLKLAVHSEGAGEPNFDSEQKLRRLAETNGWLIQNF